jgi:hypothetical protein
MPAIVRITLRRESIVNGPGSVPPESLYNARINRSA